MSSLGFYFMLPLATSSMFVLQRAFPYMVVPPRSTLKNLRFRVPRKSSLLLSLSADARLINNSCREQCHQQCVLYRSTTSFFEGLPGALGSRESAMACYVRHLGSLLHSCRTSTDEASASQAFQHSQAVRPGLRRIVSSAVSAGDLHLDSEPADATVCAADGDQGRVTGSVGRSSSASSHLPFNSSVTCETYMLGDSMSDTKSGTPLASAVETEAWTRRQRAATLMLLDAPPTVAAEVTEGGKRKGSKRTKAASERTGREGKRLKLGLLPEQLLVLTTDAPTAEDHGVLVVSNLEPGPQALQKIIDERIAAMEDDGMHRVGATALALADVAQAQGAQGLARWRRMDERLGMLFQRERQSTATALRHRIESLVEAYTFYQDLQAYCTTLAENAGKGRTALIEDHDADAAVADLVLWILDTINASARHSAKQQRQPVSAPRAMSLQGSAVPEEIVSRLLQVDPPTGSSSVPASVAGGGEEQVQAWLRRIPAVGLMGKKSGRRKKAEQVQIPLFDVLLQLLGRQFAQVLGSEHGERDPSMLTKSAWPAATRRINMRIDIIKTFYDAHGNSHRALAVPGVCALVSKPFWFFEATYASSFFDKTRGYRMPEDWWDIVFKGRDWTVGCETLQRLFDLTMGGD